MAAQNLELPWENPDWLAQATEWVYSQLAAHGWRRTGPLTILHQRPWSTLASVQTADGTVYFKAPAPPFYEAALTQSLARWRPNCTIPLLAVDLDRGWLLSENAGVTLRTVDQPSEQIEHWLKVLPLYVELQLEMADHIPELLSLGLYDRRLARLPHLYSELLDASENLRIGLKPGLTPGEHQRLQELQPKFSIWCEELDSFRLPETLTHEEIHDANVLVNGEQYLFIDWSDSSIAHPFFTMLVTLRAAAHRLNLAEDGPEIGRLRDAYLEPWTKFETRSNLLVAFKLAYRLAMVNRAISWHQGTGSLSKKHKEPYADAVPGWLQDFLVAQT